MSETELPSPALETFGYKQELKRTLGLADLLVYGLVFIAPGAPVAVFGIVYNASQGMVPLVYLVGLIAMVFTALSYMTMSRLYPWRAPSIPMPAGASGTLPDSSPGGPCCWITC